MVVNDSFNNNFLKSLIQERDHYVYKHESKDRYIGICEGNIYNGWCITNDSTLGRNAYYHGKIKLLKKSKMKVEY